tara:strand:- start:7272 stop:7454 length:183 start_codon:yes stop_codon:yes gene_type:complete
MLAELIAKQIFSEENKNKIISQINKNVNIPMIGEDTEAKVFEALFEVIEEATLQVLKKNA